MRRLSVLLISLLFLISCKGEVDNQAKSKSFSELLDHLGSSNIHMTYNAQEEVIDLTMTPGKSRYRSDTNEYEVVDDESLSVYVNNNKQRVMYANPVGPITVYSIIDILRDEIISTGEELFSGEKLKYTEYGSYDYDSVKLYLDKKGYFKGIRNYRNGVISDIEITYFSTLTEEILEDYHSYETVYSLDKLIAPERDYIDLDEIKSNFKGSINPLESGNFLSINDYVVKYGVLVSDLDMHLLDNYEVEIVSTKEEYFQAGMRDKLITIPANKMGLSFTAVNMSDTEELPYIDCSIIGVFLKKNENSVKILDIAIDDELDELMSVLSSPKNVSIIKDDLMISWVLYSEDKSMAMKNLLVKISIDTKKVTEVLYSDYTLLYN